MTADIMERARILIVEDEPMIALDLETLLVDAGFQITAVAGDLGKALALIESGACNAAVVDANLAGVSASPVAAALTARGLPFVVLSGYSPKQLHEDFSRAPFIQKPYRIAQLIHALDRINLKR